MSTCTIDILSVTQFAKVQDSFKINCSNEQFIAAIKVCKNV